MKKILSLAPLLVALPGALFWVVLLFWSNDHRPGEHWEYVAAEWLLFFIADACCLACVAGGVITMWKDRRSRYWWLSALVNFTPLLLYLEIVL